MQKIKSRTFCSLTWLLLIVWTCATFSAGATWSQGTFIACGTECLYRLPYPHPFPDGQVITRYGCTSEHSLVPPGTHDVGQTLSVTVESSEYLVVLGELAVLLYKDDPANAMLLYVSATAYSVIGDPSYLPRRLLKSYSWEENFFLLSEGNLPIHFGINPDTDEIYRHQSEITQPLATISTVAQAYSADYHDDIYVMVIDGNSLRLYSLLSREYVRTISMSDHCDDVTALYTLPPLTNDSKISFVINCLRDTVLFQYYVTTTYLLSEAPEVHQLNTVGTPVATSTYFAIRHGNGVTVYDRRHMREGVPPNHMTTSPVHRVAAFETDNTSFFLLFEANKNLTLIIADVFFISSPQGVTPLPSTLQGSCDPVCLPYAVMSDGVLVTAVGDGEYDIVTLTYDSASSTLSQSVRVGRIPDSPAFVDFLADPNPVNSPTTQPTSPPTSPPTTPPTKKPTTTPPATTMSFAVPQASRVLSHGEVAATVVVCVIVTVVIAVVVLVILAVLGLNKKKDKKQLIEPTSPTDQTPPAPTHDKRYTHPIPESGDEPQHKAGVPPPPSAPVLNSEGAPAPVTIKIEDTSNWTKPEEEVNPDDPGYISAKQTPLPGRLNVDDRHVESRQSTSSVGTMSTTTDISSTGGDAYSV